MPTWPNRPAEFYLAALSDPNSRTRRQAAAALETLRDPRAVEPLIALLGGDENSDVRANAARALGKLGDPRAVAPLIRALGDTVEAVRESAVLALEQLGDPRAAPHIFPLIEDPDHSVRYNAARAAAKLGGALAVEPLMRALRQASGYLDPMINAALGMTGEPAREPLLAALHDDNPVIRARAAASLYAYYTDDQVFQALTAAMDDPNQDVRTAARSSLQTIENGRIYYGQVKNQQAPAQRGAVTPAPHPATGAARKPEKDGQPVTFDWHGLMTQWNADLLADEEIRAELPSEVIAAGWLGYPSASEEQIAALENRLGATLPPSYRAFLAFSNGWRATGPFIPAIWSTDEVEWYTVRNQEGIDAWLDGERYVGTEPDPVSDEEYLAYDEHGAATGEMRSEYLQTALEISDHEIAGDAVYLLNPQIVTPEGEWEAWFFASWIPGAVRYRSFWEMMVAEHKGYLSLRERRR